MIFDDWGIPSSGVAGLTGSDPFFGHGQFSYIDERYGDFGVAGLDRPGADLGGYSELFGEAFVSGTVLDNIAPTPFLLDDGPVATGEPKPGQTPGFGMSYSMRMLIDMSGGHSSFSRISSWR